MNTYTECAVSEEHQLNPFLVETTSRILIVDGEVFFRQLLEEELVEKGYAVQSTGDAHAVRGIITWFNPDLILLDLYMHGNTGWQILNECKEARFELPVIVLTAHDSFSHDPRFVLADGIILKNTRLENLLQIIHFYITDKTAPLQHRRHVLHNSGKTFGKAE